MSATTPPRAGPPGAGPPGGGVPSAAVTGADLPDVAYAVALGALRGMTPLRLSHLLAGGSAREAHAALSIGDQVLVERLLRISSFGPSGSDRDEQDPARLPSEHTWGESGSIGGMERRRARIREQLLAWQRMTRALSVMGYWRSLGERGISVARRGEPEYPARMLRVELPPELIYFKGSIAHASSPCVGIVGTRRATHYGLSVASEFARELAIRGVVVVSGLALGIDAAAHAGAIGAGERAAAPLAVVGGGVDVVYPPQNRRLWDSVLTLGGLLSEAPPGAAPEPWRFPLRNRLIAGLSQVLVIVESSRQGGAIHTVQAADSLDVRVLAVPGSIRSPQSEGTNALLVHGGASPATHVDDVLVALESASMKEGGLISFGPRTRRPDDLAPRDRLTGRSPARSGPSPGRSETRSSLLRQCTPEERSVFEAVEDTATSMESICARTRLDLGRAALALDHLEEVGLVRAAGSDWLRL